MTELLEEPRDKQEGRPHELTLREAFVVTCGYLRQNIVEDVWADIFDCSVPRAHLLWAAAALLLEAIADDAPGDPDAFAVALVRDLGRAEPDRALFPALIRVALGRFERHAGQGTAESALVAEIAGLLGEARGPPSGGSAWPGEPLTKSETRVLRYLPTHLGVSEIAAELYLSANTVKTHLRHLYHKLGAHSRREAVQRARVIGLLTGPPAGPRTPDGRTAAPYMNGGRGHGLQARRTEPRSAAPARSRNPAAAGEPGPARSPADRPQPERNQ